MYIYKETNVSEKEIDEYLLRVNNCLLNNRYKISDINRDNNMKFINKYFLKHKKIIRMLQTVSNKDFCYRTQNIHKDRNTEILYIFKKVFYLDYYSKTEEVEVYIKINMILRNCQDFCFIVSFHE